MLTKTLLMSSRSLTIALRGVPFRRLEMCLYHLANGSDGRQHAEEGESTGVQHLLAIHEDLELAVVAIFGGDVNAKLAPQHGCHPGSLEAGDSIPAATDRDDHGMPPGWTQRIRRRVDPTSLAWWQMASVGQR